MINFKLNKQAIKEFLCSHRWKMVNVYTKTTDFQCIKCGKMKIIKNYE